MKLVVAIVRSGKLKEVEDALAEEGVPDISVSRVAGFAGERILRAADLTPHVRVEVVLPDSRVDGVVERICRAASTGLAGDGIVYVQPLDEVVKVKTRFSRDEEPGSE